MTQAMISNMSQGDWEPIEIDEAKRMIEAGLAYECTYCTYEDKIPSFHFTEQVEDDLERARR